MRCVLVLGYDADAFFLTVLTLPPLSLSHLRASGCGGVRSRRTHVQREQRAHSHGEPRGRWHPHHLRCGPPVSRYRGQEERLCSTSVVWVTWGLGGVEGMERQRIVGEETEGRRRLNVRGKLICSSFHVCPGLGTRSLFAAWPQHDKSYISYLY